MIIPDFPAIVNCFLMIFTGGRAPDAAGGNLAESNLT